LRARLGAGQEFVARQRVGGRAVRNWSATGTPAWTGLPTSPQSVLDFERRLAGFGGRP